MGAPGGAAMFGGTGGWTPTSGGPVPMGAPGGGGISSLGGFGEGGFGGMSSMPGGGFTAEDEMPPWMKKPAQNEVMLGAA